MKVGSKNKMDEEILKQTAYVTSSNYRVKIIEYLQKKQYANPTSISDDTGINASHTSKTLTELSGHGLVSCINPEARKKRLYCLTSQGRTVLEYLNILK